MTWSKRKYSRLDLSALPVSLTAAPGIVKVQQISEFKRLNFPTAFGTLSRAAYSRAIGAGICVMPLVKKAGLTREQMENSEIRIDVRSQIKFLNFMAKRLSDELLGFHLARSLDIRELGPLYYVASSAETLGDALQRTTRYSTIVNEGVRIRYIEKKEIGIVFEYAGVSRHSDRQQIESIVTATLQLLRQLSGQRLVPLCVKLSHHRDGVSSELKAFFGCNVEFGTSIDAVFFPKSIKDIPLASSDPFLSKLLTDYCDKIHAHQSKSARPALRSSTENAMAPLLPHGKARIEEVARALGLSTRTLARRLASEGLSFSLILNELRQSLAECYLEEANMTISTIAWMLGYREVSAFTHAFKRWTGNTPRQARVMSSNVIISAQAN